ncbi:putative RNA-directed DNA polymerase from transposon BS [Trichonephila clavipes]|nr:putative RNA-directed DNA polymerase from transposon BS [Trichonephila clavipes]
MTQQTAPWENWHLERGVELLRIFGLVRWGLGGSGNVEGTGEKLSFASQALLDSTGARGSLTSKSWLLYQLVYNSACLVVSGGAWMGSCIAERGLSRGHYWLLNLGLSLTNWSSENQKGFSSSFLKKIQNKGKIQNASIKTPIPPYPTHDARPMDSLNSCPGKDLALPNLHIDNVAKCSRFLILSLPNNEIARKSPFVVRKAIIGIGGEAKSIKKLRSGDLLIETTSALQSKSFLLAKTFSDFPLTVTPHTHKSLNSCRGVISEPDLLSSSKTEILEGLSDQGVTQVRRITIKKDSSLFPTKNLILTFNSPKLLSAIKVGYLNCKVRPYIPNPLRCFKCQRFGHSQTSCRGQLTCSRCASVEHASTDCILEPKCINCSLAHSADSKLCSKWRIEKQIQEIKTTKNISYPEARKLIVPQLSQAYTQAAKSSTLNNSTHTDENITKIKCPPLKLLAPISSKQRPNIPTGVTTSSSTQTQLLPSISSKTFTISNPQPPTPMSETKGKIKEQPSPVHRPQKDSKKIYLIIVKPTTNLKKNPAKKHIRKDCEGTRFPQ